jgi:hypothetical protein
MAAFANAVDLREFDPWSLGREEKAAKAPAKSTAAVDLADAKAREKRAHDQGVAETLACPRVTRW